MTEPTPGNDGSAKDISPERQSLIKWGRQPLIESDWIRKQAESVGLNTERMLLGHALRSIVGDDWNAYVYLHEGIDDRDSIEQGRDNALIRLNWELGLEELPDVIKEKLIPLKEAIEKSDWMDKEQYESTKKQFMAVRDEVREMKESDPSLDSALEYFNVNYGYQRRLPAVPKNS